MKLAILSRNSGLYSTKRLKEAATQRGHTARILDTLKFAIDLDKGQPDLFYNKKPIAHYDAVLPRIGASITYFGMAVVRQFQMMDVYCVNTVNGIGNSRDKLRCMQILSRHQIGIPKTAFVRDKGDVIPAIERVGGAPVIIKLIEGTQGIGVVLAETIHAAESIIELLQSQKQNVLVQKFISESKGRDLRAIVVGDQVVASMRRVAQGQEFRSNIHRGGRAEPVELTEAYKQAAISAAQIMGLKIAGVDMLESNDGPQILEVNSSPGLEGIESCTKLDVAGSMIEFIAERVNFPEVDIHQRLSISSNYGVSEIHIPKGSSYAGQTIDQSKLMEQDLNVLTVSRGGKIYPNPKTSKIIEAGDKLLCFGNFESMRGLITDPAKKKRRSKIKAHEN